MTGHPDLVHTLTFEWQEHRRRGGSGLGLVRSSLSEAESDVWDRELANRVSVPSGDDQASTCYLHLRGRAVLLHRVPAPDRLDRPSTRTRALLGPPSLVTFSRAVALRPGSAMSDADGGPYPDFPAAWTDSCDDDAHMIALVVRNREAVVRMLAGMLGGRGRTGFAIRPHGTDPRLLLWAAAQCLDHRAWTFSTREANPAEFGLPEFVFVPGRPRTNLMAERRWVDLGREIGDPVAFDRATDMVAWMLDGDRPIRIRPRQLFGPRPEPTPEPPLPVGNEELVAEPPRGQRVRTAYAIRLSLLIGWSLLFIAVLALAGRAQS